MRESQLVGSLRMVSSHKYENRTWEVAVGSGSGISVSVEVMFGADAGCVPSRLQFHKACILLDTSQGCFMCCVCAVVDAFVECS